MEQFLGQIQQFGYSFAPRGWAFCHGQLMTIQHNEALFSLLGTSYGGDGITTFALPDFRPKDEHGMPINLYIGEMYQNKPYMETCIAIEGLYPNRN